MELGTHLTPFLLFKRRLEMTSKRNKERTAKYIQYKHTQQLFDRLYFQDMAMIQINNNAEVAKLMSRKVVKELMAK